MITQSFIILLADKRFFERISNLSIYLDIACYLLQNYLTVYQTDTVVVFDPEISLENRKIIEVQPW